MGPFMNPLRRDVEIFAEFGYVEDRILLWRSCNPGQIGFQGIEHLLRYPLNIVRFNLNLHPVFSAITLMYYYENMYVCKYVHTQEPCARRGEKRVGTH